jgi:hypothetical protein
VYAFFPFLAEGGHSSTPVQVVLTTIVTQCPSSSLAPTALAQLNAAVDLFATVASNFRAEKTLASNSIPSFDIPSHSLPQATLDSLRVKAQEILVAYRAGSVPASQRGSPTSPTGEEGPHPALGASTRVILRRPASDADPEAALAARLAFMRTHLGLDMSAMGMAAAAAAGHAGSTDGSANAASGSSGSMTSLSSSAGSSPGPSRPEYDAFVAQLQGIPVVPNTPVEGLAAVFPDYFPGYAPPLRASWEN